VCNDLQLHGWMDYAPSTIFQLIILALDGGIAGFGPIAASYARRPYLTP
jgi:hypothetical protein